MWPVDFPGELSGVEPAYDISYQSDLTQAPRAWWFMWESQKRCPGILKGIRKLFDMLLRDKYEGVFGFSQGAAMAATVSAMLERPYLYPEFLVDGLPPHPPFKFCIAVSGFIPPCPFSDAVFSTSYLTLHYM